MADENQAQLRPVVTRKEARAAGLKRYFTGRPCGRQHISERLTSVGSCVECATARSMQWRSENRDAERKRSTQYRVDSPEKSKENGRRWYAANSEKRKVSLKRWRENNFEKNNQIIAAWAKANPNKRRAYVRKCQKKRYDTPTGNLNARISAAIRGSLAQGTGKGGVSWQTLVGYTLEQIKVHIERQFVKGMSWDNRDKWHIDHIVPLASFTFTSPNDTEFKAAWALTNLRPLWKKANISKGAKREFLL